MPQRKMQQRNIKIQKMQQRKMQRSKDATKNYAMQKKLQRREKQRTKDVAHKTHNTWRSVIRGQNITHNAMGNGARCPVQHTKDKVDSTLRVYLRPQNAIFQKTCTIVKVGFGEPDYIRIGNKSNCCFFQVRLASPVVRGSWCLLSLVLPQVPDKYCTIS